MLSLKDESQRTAFSKRMLAKIDKKECIGKVLCCTNASDPASGEFFCPECREKMNSNNGSNSKKRGPEIKICKTNLPRKGML